MARLVFGAAVDWARVRVHACPYLWFGLQPEGVAMAPDGGIYFGRSCHRDDFSVEDDACRRWFMHEMTHVWQHQLGYPVKWRGALRIGLRYAYALAPGRRLDAYDMEAQAELLADYFALRHLRAPQVMRQPCAAQDVALYEDVLQDFLRDPARRVHLPSLRAMRRARADGPPAERPRPGRRAG